MANRTCTIGKCAKPHVARGMCHRHYKRWQEKGDPTVTAVIVGDDVRRFWSKVDRRSDSECWPWRGDVRPNGYSRFRLRDGHAMGHRYAYELAFGPIPDGLTIDHVAARGCTMRSCVNPAHLEAVTAGVNCLRGHSPHATNAAKTHCKRGHEFTPQNTMRAAKGGRRCRACQYAYAAAQRAKRRGENNSC